jgi:hypothetical protein
MKKYLYILMSAMLMVMSAGCSSDDDSGMPEGGQENLIPLYSSNDLHYRYNTHVEALGNWNVCKDDEVRFRWATLYETTDPIDQLYAAPSSYEELNGKLFKFMDSYPLWQRVSCQGGGRDFQA